MNAPSRSKLGLGIGWRPELALAIERRADLGFIEVLAEDLDPDGPLPEAIAVLVERGVTPILHGVSLSLGGAEPLDRAWLATLGRLAKQLGAPLVSEHLAFVRGGGLETGHLLPVPYTKAALDVVIENVRATQAALPVPLALENIATLFDWPAGDFDESAFLAEVLDRTGAGFLLDVENVYANALNRGRDPVRDLLALPLDRIAYLHVAGGVTRGEHYQDTHTHDVPRGVLDLLEELTARVSVPGVMLERDGAFPSDAGLNTELDAIQAAMARGALRRQAAEAPHAFGR